MKLTKLYLVLIVLAGWACQSEKEPDPNNCDDSPEVSLVSTTNLTTCSALDGKISVGASGGAGGFMFSIGGSDFQNSGDFNELGAGTFDVFVRDAKGCTAQLQATIDNPDSDLDFTAITDKDDECLTNNGSLMVNAIGGAGPYMYNIGDGFVSSAEFVNLESGNYTMVVMDAEGCTVSSPVVVERGDTGISYIVDIDPIVKAKCAISGCHNGNNTLPNYNELATFQSLAAGVKSRTQSRDMPRIGSLTNDQIALIA